MVAFPLQFALDLFNFRSLASGGGDLACENYVQHVKERVSRDVCRSPSMGNSLERN